MNIFLAIQNNYQEIQIALYKNNEQLDFCSIDKKEASKLLTISLSHLLNTHQIDPNRLSFIAVNQGPAPFTTLRVVLASMNGFSFASGIPLIGIDAFDAMSQEWRHADYPTTVILLNAFAGELYFSIERDNMAIQRGYQHADVLVTQCAQLSGPIRFLGNGAALYRTTIETVLHDKASFSSISRDYCSIETIATLGYQEWKTGNKGSFQLLPLYLKKHQAEIAFYR